MRISDEERRERKRKWYERNKAKVKAAQLEWRKKHREYLALKTRNWAKENPEKTKAAIQKWRENNLAKIHASEKVRSRERKEKVLNHYSGGVPKCICCGETTFEFLSIDHINGGGRKHIRQLTIGLYPWLIKNNYPDGYRVLCMNCNFARGAYGYCPHEKNKEVHPCSTF